MEGPPQAADDRVDRLEAVKRQPREEELNRRDYRRMGLSFQTDEGIRTCTLMPQAERLAQIAVVLVTASMTRERVLCRDVADEVVLTETEGQKRVSALVAGCGACVTGQGLGSPGRPPGRLSGLPERVRPAGRCQLSELMRPFRLMCRTGCGRVGRLPEDLAWCTRLRAAQQPGSRDAQQGGWNAAASPALCGRR